MRTIAFLLCLSVALAASGGCARATFEDWRTSRQAAEDCESLHGAGSDECLGLRAQADRDYQRYEAESRVGWGCGANAPDQNCPSPR